MRFGSEHAWTCPGVSFVLGNGLAKAEGSLDSSQVVSLNITLNITSLWELFIAQNMHPVLLL